MKVILTREGAQASAHRVVDMSWREAFYQSAVEAVAATGPLDVKVLVEARPFCVDNRGIAELWTVREAIEQGLEAAVAAKLIPSRRAVVEVRVHAYAVAGADGMSLTFSDCAEPF
jgi:hypothetical protein